LRSAPQTRTTNPETQETSTDNFEFGSLAKSDDIKSWFLNLASQAEQNISAASFELLAQETSVKVMGTKQFEDYSKALDRAMRMTQGFLVVTTLFFFYTMFQP